MIYSRIENERLFTHRTHTLIVIRLDKTAGLVSGKIEKLLMKLAYHNYFLILVFIIIIRFLLEDK